MPAHGGRDDLAGAGSRPRPAGSSRAPTTCRYQSRPSRVASSESTRTCSTTRRSLDRSLTVAHRSRAIRQAVAVHHRLGLGASGQGEHDRDDERRSAARRRATAVGSRARTRAAQVDVRVVHQRAEPGVQQHRAGARRPPRPPAARTPSAGSRRAPARRGSRPRVSTQRPAADRVVGRRDQVGGQPGAEAGDQPERPARRRAPAPTTTSSTRSGVRTGQRQPRTAA